MVTKRKMGRSYGYPGGYAMDIKHGRKRSSMRGSSFAKRLAASAASAVVNSVTRTAQRRRRDDDGGGGVTSQYDSRLLYRRRRAPKRIRRRARRLNYRYLKNALRHRAMLTNLFQANSTGVGATSTGSQKVFSIDTGIMYNTVGAAASFSVGRIYDVVQNIINADPIASQRTYFIHSITTDYTLTNIAATDTAEVDIYEYVFRKNTSWGDGDAATTPMGVYRYFEENVEAETQLPGATSAMVSTDLGWSPFDANQALSNVVIKSKRRYYIGAGQAFSFVKNVKFKVPIKLTATDISKSSIASTAGQTMAWRGLTRGIIIVYKGLPNASNAAASVNMAYNAQTRYQVKYLDSDPNGQAIGN